eukprot:snap_masked-scaffold_8-processed-gene-11.17-mRNA-1 protein AED:1.00 eAED:1.00 QI:0/-1/0/0/-1/1/1/0/246
MLPEDQIYTFIDDAMKIPKFLDKDQMNRNQKKILKTILSKIPEAFNFNVDEMLLDVKELNLLKLRSKMMKRRFVLRVKVNKTKQVSGLKTSHLPLYQHEDERKRKQFKKVGCVILRRIGKEATPINLILFHLSNKQYIQVNGIADTGADYNVSSIQALRDFTIKTEDPQYIKEVQFPDKSQKRVEKVVYTRAMLTQGEKTFKIGVQKFFTVNDPNWEEIIIGRRTLDYFGIKLDLSQANHAKEKDE